ncbi:NAD kinase [Aquimarina sp. ERC-38]|uniref:NAD kinase n=1 Tax=Aquimarina sp. ERC-38 TaxID=2949996 RepID=UPI0022467D9B|nr:NAD kinase [Aquimarina sp. ERC-38]UZO81180.1 NAD kinase [Aquimarina sp. ERC-38]
MKVGIYGQFYHEHSGTYIQLLLDTLKKNKAEIFIEKNFLEVINQNDEVEKNYSSFSVFENLDTSYDLLFSIGGDGTILKTITYVKDLGIPIAGINTGRLGFLATIKKEELEESITLLLHNHYKISARTLLSVKTQPPHADFNNLDFAMNEITVSRRNSTSMITVRTTLNNEYLTTYWADGLIVATPTGSTGYSLSCGGPVMTPDASCFVLTPIAPHNLNARPLVIPDNQEIKLEVISREGQYLTSFDSRMHSLPNETTLILKKASFKIKMVVLEHDSFLKTLRKKMLWGEDKRN